MTVLKLRAQKEGVDPKSALFFRKWWQSKTKLAKEFHNCPKYLVEFEKGTIDEK